MVVYYLKKIIIRWVNTVDSILQKKLLEIRKYNYQNYNKKLIGLRFN